MPCRATSRSLIHSKRYFATPGTTAFPQALILSMTKIQANPEAYANVDRQITNQAEMLVGAFMPGQLLDQKGRRLS